MDMTTKAIKTYDEIAQEDAKKIANREPKMTLELFKKYIPQGSSVLDAGCAAGRDSRKLSANDYVVTGVDLSEKLLAIAKKEHPTISFIKADIRSLPFKKETFDAIWAVAVIHHLEKKDISKALNEFYRVLRPHGYLFLTTKKGHGKKRISEELSLFRKREFSLLTKEELNKLLDEACFKQKELHEMKSKEREAVWFQAVFEKEDI